MAQVINTNIASLTAQRNLNKSQSNLQTSLQRLSSGLRINSAKDDAAGLAISERMSSQIRGMDVAMRNANDGISLAQTAEGALVEIGNNLQRIRELAIQSANASNSEQDRKALNAEVAQLVSEIDRVANQTEFNGTKLLNGEFSAQLFQVGANAGQTIGINSIVDAKASELGKVNFAEDHTYTIATGSATVGTITINDVAIDFSALDDLEVEDADELAKHVANAINAKMDQTGVYAEVDGASLTLVSINADKDLEVDVTGSYTLGITDQTNAAESASSSTTVNDLDITGFAGAQRAVEIADKALEVVNTTRADMGAVQNRFESVIANLSTSSENLSASRSRIMDTDFAKETAALTRGQILQQAGTAMLAQANSLPQNVLSLLG